MKVAGMEIVVAEDCHVAGIVEVWKEFMHRLYLERG